MDVTNVLDSVEAMWRVLCNQGIYGPALQIKVQEKVTAFNAAVQQAVQTELQKLEQNRGAKSSIGNRNGGRKGACFDCGKEGHHRGDPTCSKAKTSGKSTGHGLDEATTKHINQLGKAKIKEYPDLSKVPDGLEIVENGKVIAKFCSNCLFFSKGATMHSSTTHGLGAPTLPTPSAQANIGAIPPHSTTTPGPSPNPDPVLPVALPAFLMPPAQEWSDNLGRGFRLGGLMAATSPDPAPTTFPPNLRTNYELGLHSEDFHDALLTAPSDDSDNTLSEILGILGKDFGR
jgi:hypothetical protein